MRRTLGMGFTALSLTVCGPASGESVATILSERQIEVSSSFSGETVTLFGNISAEPDSEIAPPYQVVVLVEGPPRDFVVRHKANRAGIWMNTSQTTFDALPSYFHVAASEPLTEIASISSLVRETADTGAMRLLANGSGRANATRYAGELIRLMEETGQLHIDTGAAKFISSSAYSARVTLQASAASGLYLARTLVFKDGAIVATSRDDFVVRKIGFERFLANSASEQPLLYGLACVVLAVITGWLGGWLFKR